MTLKIKHFEVLCTWCFSIEWFLFSPALWKNWQKQFNGCYSKTTVSFEAVPAQVKRKYARASQIIPIFAADSGVIISYVTQVGNSWETVHWVCQFYLRRHDRHMTRNYGTRELPARELLDCFFYCWREKTTWQFGQSVIHCINQSTEQSIVIIRLKKLLRMNSENGNYRHSRFESRNSRMESRDQYQLIAVFFSIEISLNRISFERFFIIIGSNRLYKKL